MRLSDGREITQTTTPKGVYLRDGQGKPVTRESIRALLDSYAVNIGRLVGATAEERLKLFLEAMPVTVTAEQLQAACGDLPVVEPTDASGHALPAIDKVYDRVEAARKDLNVAVRTQKGYVAQLEKALPPAETETAAQEYETVRTQRLEAQIAIKEAERAIDTALKTENDVIDADADVRTRGIKGRIAELQAELTEISKSSSLLKLEAVGRIRGAHQVAASEAQQAHAALASREATLKAQADEHTRGKVTREAIANVNGEIDLTVSRSNLHTLALERLADLRNNLTKDLPISGLEIRDGEIYYKGVHFDDLNTATWVTLFVGLAALRAPNGGFIVLDGAECLDSDKLAGLEAYCKKKKLQVVYALVSEGPLRVEAE